MKGSILLPISLFLTVALPGLSMLINADNFQAALDSSISIKKYAESLRVPYDIEYAMMKYSDEKDSLYSAHLKSAWQSAADAKAKSSDIWGILTDTKFSLKDGDPTLELGLNFYNKEEEVRASFSKALESSYYTLQGLINLIDSDRIALDQLGADNAMFRRSQVFGELLRTMDMINAETRRDNMAPRIEANPCSLTGFRYRTICIIRQMTFLQEPSPGQAVAIFNEIVGYPAPSLLEEYLLYHQNLSTLALDMFNEYDDSLEAFEKNLAEAEEKTAKLKKEQIMLVDAQVSNFITSQSSAEVAVSAGAGGTFSGRFAALLESTAVIKWNKTFFDRIFEQEQDDFLFLSAEGIKGLNSELKELSAASDGLSADFTDLRRKAESRYNELALSLKDKSTSALYLEALGIGERAKSSVTGEAITAYSKAIGLLLFIGGLDSNSLSVDSQLNYLKKTLESLGKFGIDVTYESEQYLKLAKIGNPILLSQVSEKLQELAYKLGYKADFALDKVQRYKELLADYFAEYHAFSGNPAIREKLDIAKLDELEKKYFSSLTFDVLSNLEELYTEYAGMAGYIEKELNSVASDYLSDYVSFSYELLDNQSCMEFSSARLLMSVRNPSNMAFYNVTISKSPAFETYPGEPLYFEIGRIGPGEIGYTEHYVSVFNNCSEPAASETQIEKSFFELNNGIVKLCFFTDCAALKKIYKEAYASRDLALISSAFSEEAGRFISEFANKSVKKRIDSIALLLTDFKKAVELTDASENITTLFSISDYSIAKSDYVRLKKIYDFLTPAAMMSIQPELEFEKLVQKFDPQDLLEFFEDLGSLENRLNSSLESMRNEAKAALLAAKENADDYTYLQKALDSYNHGRFNQAILFSALVPRQQTEADFTGVIYLGVAAILVAFTILLIRRPKKEAKLARRILRAT